MGNPNIPDGGLRRIRSLSTEDGDRCHCGVLWGAPLNLHAKACPFPLLGYTESMIILDSRNAATKEALRQQWMLMWCNQPISDLQAYNKALASRDVLHITAELFEYFLNVLPPRKMNGVIVMGDTRQQEYSFLFQEGMGDPPVVFWNKKDVHNNTYYFAQVLDNKKGEGK